MNKRAKRRRTKRERERGGVRRKTTVDVLSEIIMKGTGEFK